MVGTEFRSVKYLKEWIIFALCMGMGGHIALGLVLHAPEVWSISTVWQNGLVLALSLYVIIQVMRSIFWLFVPGHSKSEE